MRILLLYSFILYSLLGFSQPPTGYYNSAQGLTGFALKTELKENITNGYNGQSYGDLLDLYETSDNDDHYDAGGSFTILDIYSENPDGPDAYNYFFNDNCGNVSSNEGGCYNREHLFPQGRFNRQEPMRCDAHHVVPTDGQVNGRRSSFPFGVVNNPSFTSLNGSKVGPSVTPGFNGTVFEPIDEFKGDIARSLLYFATRYEDNFNDQSWDSPNATNDPRDGSQNRWYEQWYIDLLVQWHNQDPVGDRELERNNEVFKHQNNRNPYIDNPDYVNMIWSTTASNEDALLASVSIYPNPSNGLFSIRGLHEMAGISIWDVSGRLIQSNYSLDEDSFRIDGAGVYFVKLEANTANKVFKVIVN